LPTRQHKSNYNQSHTSFNVLRQPDNRLTRQCELMSTEKVLIITQMCVVIIAS